MVNVPRPRAGSGEGAAGLALVFFFQAEDGIRDLTVTGVQTCALPISADRVAGEEGVHADLEELRLGPRALHVGEPGRVGLRSEERRVGKECRSRWSPYH